MTSSMSGKVALVTGGNSGIGEATAKLLASRGARVAILARKGAKADAVISHIAKSGGSAFFIKTDVADAQQVQAAVQHILDTCGRLDYAVNNAAAPSSESGLMAPTADIEQKSWQRTMDVNLTGVWLGMKYQIPAMIKSGGGAIVNTSSLAGGKAIPGLGSYCAAKFGLHGISKAAAMEYATHGIRVNVVMPGIVHTPIVDEFEQKSPGYIEGMRAAVPMGRLGKVDEIAKAIVWLCSDEASFITGVHLPVDGGMLEK